ncbi:hypothetical protein SAMN05421823_10862 [Catalinimonas alkaloidigena]|uniref:Outer membrane protein beta-barrel domain-containing protein n=1 Tax=Catalinimonas alkaloidigena TaxID=1075417 RepID=A0A1G9MRH5_9BACT|nr:hypothetical protein [Catalinimonas alkaloidigena]SDL76713.1 hypothetical protein SAMN05421823_10862 [Catalinimonas alkaloidigena]
MRILILLAALTLAPLTTTQAQFYRRLFGDTTDNISPARFKAIYKYYPGQMGEYRFAYEKPLNNATSLEFDLGYVYNNYVRERFNVDNFGYELRPTMGVAARVSYRRYPKAVTRRRRTLNGIYRGPLLLYKYNRFNYDSYGYDTEGRNVVDERLRLRQHVVGLQYMMGRQINLARTFSFALQWGVGARVKFANMVQSSSEDRSWLLDRTPGATVFETPTSAIKVTPTAHLNFSVGYIVRNPKKRKGFFGLGGKVEDKKKRGKK